MRARVQHDTGGTASRLVLTRYRRSPDLRSRRCRCLQRRLCDLALLRAPLRYYVDRLILDENRKPRSERFVAIVDAALEAWGARWPLYLAIVIVCVGIQIAVAYIARFDPLATFIANCLVDGYATAFFTIAIAAHRQEVKAPAGEIARAALARYPVVLLVYFGIQIVMWAFLPWIFGTAEEMAYGLGILPTLLVYAMMYI